MSCESHLYDFRPPYLHCSIVASLYRFRFQSGVKDRSDKINIIALARKSFKIELQSAGFSNNSLKTPSWDELHMAGPQVMFSSLNLNKYHAIIICK